MLFHGIPFLLVIDTTSLLSRVAVLLSSSPQANVAGE